MSLHIETPLLASSAMSANGQTVWLKMEAMQPPGSFKIRGVGFACETYQRRGATRFISSSGGNAGIAAAYAGRKLNVPVLVVVPETTTARARELIRRENAEIIVHGASFQEANALAQSMVGATDAFIHPFDDPLLWEGHASMIDEVARAGVKPDVVVLSVGGGGLMCGVVEGLRRNDWDQVPVIAVETHGADSLAQSMAAGERIELPGISSIATSLGARKVSEQAGDGPGGGGCLYALHRRPPRAGGAGVWRRAGSGVRRAADAGAIQERAGDCLRRRNGHARAAAQVVRGLTRNGSVPGKWQSLRQ
jgi:L-serine/L-threonine ammonia-lyase